MARAQGANSPTGYNALARLGLSTEADLTLQFPQPQKQKGQPLRGQPLVVPRPPRERGGVWSVYLFNDVLQLHLRLRRS